MAWMQDRVRERGNDPHREAMDANQNLVLNILASLQDYERELAAERLATGLPPLGAAEFLDFLSDHLRSQFLEPTR